MITNNLTIAVNEKDVENLYRHGFLNKFKGMEITSPFGCDGFGVHKESSIRVLMEFKDDLQLTNKLEVVKVISQSLFYIKKFYNKGLIPPSTIFVGDRNECFVMHVNDVLKYLDLEIDWNSAPSSAHRIPELVTALMNDDNIKPFIFEANQFEQCIEKVKELTDNIVRQVLVTDKNITEVFRYFDSKVLSKSVKLTTNQRANLFIQLLLNDTDNYLHPAKKRKTIVTKSFGEVSIVSREAFESFFGHFSSTYTPTQKHKLAAVVDRIIEDTTRRKQGEFFTPSIWVDKAHEYIASVFGEDWKEKYIVWDPAWGTGNLTRDYKFKELYVSTLNQSDIDTANQMGYNTEAVKFQYDFLNDDYEKLPVGLRNAIESGKEIIVLMNPPYATSTDMRNTSNDETMHKSGTSETVVYKEMISKGFGKGSEQLYSQFVYKIKTLGNCHIAMFTKPLFISGPTFTIFREKILKDCNFKKGFLMDSSNFADVKSWGLTFSILENNSKENEFIYDVLELLDFEIVKISEKTIYSTETCKPMSEWIREEIKQYQGTKITLPHLSSAMKVVNKKVAKEISQNYLGSYVGLGNNVQRNDRGVTLLSSTGVQGNAKVSLSITNENFYKIISGFVSRKIVEPNWVNEKDEYLAPNERHESFNQFTIDSIVYSLFNNSSEQSSLRQVEYQDQQWDIKNEFFWMSVEKMKELADQNGYDELYNDARTSSDRYVYKLLFGEERIYDKLSPDAKQVLDKATELVEKSMNFRQLMADDNNHLNSWDAGYAQLKLVWKEYFIEEFKEFRQLYKNLEDRMRPLVYELGFLMK